MSVAKTLIRIGFATLGAGYAIDLFRKDNDGDAVTPSDMVRGMSGRKALGRGPTGAPNNAKPLMVKDGIRTVKFYPAGNIDNRVKYIVEQIRRDAKDKKTITEARAIVSGRCAVAKGGIDWCVQPKDWEGELKMLYWALTNPNSAYAMRYTRDPWGYDAFGSSDTHRRLPAGDCDDFAIRLGALAYAIGYPVKCRVVAPKGYPNQWAHIYLMVGSVPGEQPRKWLAMDPTEPQHGPFWEVPKHMISTVKDFEV